MVSPRMRFGSGSGGIVHARMQSGGRPNTVDPASYDAGPVEWDREVVRCCPSGQGRRGHGMLRAMKRTPHRSCSGALAGALPDYRKPCAKEAKSGANAAEESGNTVWRGEENGSTGRDGACGDAPLQRPLLFAYWATEARISRVPSRAGSDSPPYGRDGPPALPPPD